MTRTPSPVNRSAESAGATAAMTEWTYRWTPEKSTTVSRTSTPNSFALRVASAHLAAASKAFDGTQPALRLSPPILRLSTRTVGTQKAVLAAATDNPPGPPPITQMSGLSVSAITLYLSNRLYRPAERGASHRLVRLFDPAEGADTANIDGPQALPYKPRKIARRPD